jgi:hypothetical protein
MTDWRFKIDVAESFQKAKTGEVSRQQLAAEIVAQLKPIAKAMGSSDAGLQDIIDEFEWLAGAKEVEVDAFDSALEELFDWGDTPLNDSWPRRRMCWINVAFLSAAP